MSEISIKFFMPLKVASLDMKKPREELGKSIGEMIRMLKENKTKLAGDVMALLPENPQDNEFPKANLEVCVPISGKIKGVTGLTGKELGKGAFACLTHAGPIEKLGDAYSILLKWIQENEYKISGSVREIYQKGFGETGTPSQDCLIEIQFPVRK